MLPHQPFPAPKRLKTSLKRRVYPRHHFIPRTTPRHCTSLQDRMLPGRKGTGTMPLRNERALGIVADLGSTKIQLPPRAPAAPALYRQRLPTPSMRREGPVVAKEKGIKKMEKPRGGTTWNSARCTSSL